MSRSDDDPMGKLLKFWPLIIVLMGLAGSWAVMQFQIQSHDKRITKLEDDRDDWLEQYVPKGR